MLTRTRVIDAAEQELLQRGAVEEAVGGRGGVGVGGVGVFAHDDSDGLVQLRSRSVGGVVEVRQYRGGDVFGWVWFGGGRTFRW